MLKNKKISSRLALGFSITFIIMLSLVAVLFTKITMIDSIAMSLSQNELLVEDVENIHNHISELIYMLVGLLLLAFLAAIIIAIYITRKTSQPINHAIMVTEQIATGDFDIISPSPSSSSNTKKLLDAQEKMAKKLREMVKKINASEAQFKSIVDTSYNTIFIINDCGIIEMVNPQVEHTFGFSQKELLGENISIVMPMSEKQRHDGYISTYKEKKKKNIIGVGRELTGQKKDGTLLPIFLTISEIIQKDTVKFCGVIRDLTREKEMQSEAVQADKMASFSTLIAGVAHEINTPVGLSVTNVSELRDKTKAFILMKETDGIDEADLNEFLADADMFTGLVQDNLTRAAELVRSFKQVAVDQYSSESKNFNLRKHIEATLATLQHEFKNTDINIELECPDELVIYSIPGAFSQIITNLINNSFIHGFNSGQKSGEIKILLKKESDQVKQTSNLSPPQSDIKLKLLYCDNGNGIDKKHQEKIFEPFFTTRREKGGSGLGTHIVHNLVTQALKGNITLTSKPGEGVVFQIDIPLELGVLL